MQPVRFELHQRSELLSLGLVIEAINHLEIDALPRARFIVRPEPPRNQVSDELHNLVQKIGKAHCAIEELFNATDGAPHKQAALRAVTTVALPGRRRHIFGGARLQEASESLTKAMEVVEDALKAMPPGPMRSRSASYLPIDLIHGAVQFGFIVSGREPLPLVLRPSASPTSAFRKMIGICYEAIGAASHDPERAIKAFVKKWRAVEGRS